MRIQNIDQNFRRCFLDLSVFRLNYAPAARIIKISLPSKKGKSQIMTPLRQKCRSHADQEFLRDSSEKHINASLMLKDVPTESNILIPKTRFYYSCSKGIIEKRSFDYKNLPNKSSELQKASCDDNNQYNNNNNIPNADYLIAYSRRGKLHDIQTRLNENKLRIENLIESKGKILFNYEFLKNQEKNANTEKLDSELLQFDSKFESGNLQYAVKNNKDNSYFLILQNDTNSTSNTLCTL